MMTSLPRRWRIVLALFVVTYGIATPLAAYGVFLPILAEAFGWSRGALSTALSINLLLGGVAGFAIGALADRHGPRLMLVITVALAGAGFALVGALTALWQLYVCVGIIGGIGMSSFYLLAAATVSHWFDDRRALAIALVLVGFNLGYISAGPLAASLIGHLGWRAAYAVLGVGCGVLTLAAALTVRLPREGERPGRHAVVAGAARSGVTLGEALGDPRQWYLNVSWFLTGALAFMISVHIVPFARDHGVGLAAASLGLTAYGLGSATGRVGSGVISEHLGAPLTIRIGYVVQIVALVGVWWAPSQSVLLAALVAFGVGFAAADTMFTKVIADVFGMRALGAIMGVLALGWRAGAALGPAAAGFLYDATGSYGTPFGAAPFAVLVSWIFFALGTRRA